MNRLTMAVALCLAAVASAQDDPAVLQRTLREIRAIRGADTVIVAHVVAVHPSPGIWCGFIVTRQDVTWHVERVIDGARVDGDVRVGHLLVANSPLVAEHAPFLRPELFWPGARAVLCLKRSDGAFVVDDESCGVRLIDGEKTGDPTHATLLQIVLRLPGLKPYLPDAAEPVRLALGPALPLPLPIEGRAVRFLPPELIRGDPHVAIRALTVDGDTARVRLALPTEGVIGDVSLVRRDGVWSVTSAQFAER